MTTHGNKSERYVGVISCGMVKRPQATQARDLYIGGLFVLQRKYISLVTDEWYILSAKYGLVHRDQVISPYEQSLKRYNAKQYEVWLKHVRHQVRATFPTSTKFVSTAPLLYRAALPERQTICPWDEMPDMKMGFQRQWLLQQVKHPTWRVEQLGLGTTRVGGSDE